MAPWQRRTFGVLTLGGGAVGFSVCLQYLISLDRALPWTITLLFLLAYAWGVWIGVRVLEGAPGSARRALPYWLIQVPTFSSPLIGYFMSGGFHSTLRIEFFPITFHGNFMLGSSFSYSLFSSGAPWSVGVNLFAAAVVVWLIWWADAPGGPAATPEDAPAT